MNFFSEVVFPEVTKKVPLIVSVPKIRLDYWIRNYDGKKHLTVRCPVCYKVYDYKIITDEKEIEKNIRQYEPHYRNQFERKCPFKDSHHKEEDMDENNVSFNDNAVKVGSYIIGESWSNNVKVQGWVTKIEFDNTLYQHVYTLSTGEELYECEVVESI